MSQLWSTFYKAFAERAAAEGTSAFKGAWGFPNKHHLAKWIAR